MDALWIIIFVIAMISKILNKGQQTGGGYKQKKDQDHWWKQDQDQSQGQGRQEEEIFWHGQEWGGWDEFGNWQQREIPPVAAETKLPDIRYETKPTVPKEERPVYETPKPVESAAHETPYAIQEDPYFERAAIMPEPEPVRTLQPNISVAQEQRDEAIPGFLDINQAAMINAVIMSEILQPPVCKRKQKSRF